MNQTEIQSKNLVIHVYMCDTEEERKELEKSLNNHSGFLDLLHYHDDPIWLYPAIERILTDENVTLSMNRNGAMFKEFGGTYPSAHMSGGSIMENLFNAVHEMITIINNGKT
jgi:hypothetical protein